MPKFRIVSSMGGQPNAAPIELKSSPIETTSRLVVFLDIMGFKDYVARQDESKIREKLRVLSQFIFDNVKDQEDKSQFYIFSDSIILFSNSDNMEAFVTMLKLTIKIVEKSIELQLPIHGAMAKGICTVSSDKIPFYFGQPIIDAYKLEENVVMYGVALHNTVEELARNLDEKNKHLMQDVLLSLKGGNSRHFIVDWINNHKETNIRRLIELRASVSDSPRRYIDNTLAIVNDYSYAKWRQL